MDIFNIISSISEWVLSFGDSPWAIPVLILNSFTESIFFPIPPDPLLILLSLKNIELSIFISIITAISSVLGGIAGYYIGNKLGRNLIFKIISEKYIIKAENLFSKYGFWVIITAAFTPIPYKVFTLTAGALNLKLKKFIIASIIGRFLRFLFIGIMIYILGEKINSFLNSNFDLITIITTTSVLLLISLIIFIKNKNKLSEKL
ncbi:MAG: YqaA family protein [Dehalococcoidia bacterium]